MEGDDIVSLKRKGDKFFEKDEFRKALECYNRAIEREQSNLELLMCRARTYFKLNEYSKCLSDTEKIVELCTATKECDSLMMFRASKLMAESMMKVCPENSEKLEETFRRAMQIDVPAAEIEPLIVLYNQWKEGYQTDISSSTGEIIQGFMSFYCGGRQLAIERFTKAIENNSSNSLAFAFRAVCLAEEADREQELISDVQKSIDLDYRIASFLAHKAREFKLRSQIVPCFRLIKALGLSFETYKRGIGKFFPKLLDDKPLKESEITRFHDLNESFYTLLLDAMVRGTDSDLESDSETDSSNKEEEEEADKNKRKLSGQALSLKEKGYKFYERKQFKAALECYNKAIELDKFNLELLICRVQVYFDMEKFTKCISAAEKLIALHKSEHKKCKCEPVFRAWMLMGKSVMIQVGTNPISIEAFTQALRIDAPANEIDRVMSYRNVARNGTGDVPTSIALGKAGCLHYFRDNRVKAIKKYTEAIKYCQNEAPIYAFRAHCYAEDDRHEQELISDIKECLDLDYRVLEFFLLSSYFDFKRCPTARLRLLKALSLSEETFKQSAGRIFPKILDDKPLNKYERKRFKDLDENWSKKFKASV